MRFRDNRMTLRKNMMGFEVPPNFDPEVLAKPRELREPGVYSHFRQVPNRKARRASRKRG